MNCMDSVEELGEHVLAKAQTIAEEARAEGFDVTIDHALEAIRSALLTGHMPRLDFSDVWIGG